MARLGRKPIFLKNGVKVSVEQEGKKLTITGPLGEISLSLPQGIRAEFFSEQIKVIREKDTKMTYSLQGTYARLITNAIKGVVEGYSKSLEVVGTGFRAQMEGEDLVLFLGFSHPVRFKKPPGVKIEVQENKICVSGIDKSQVGLIADKIKKFKKPDSYKGKGIRYLGEKLKLKPGKAAAKASTPGGK